MFPCDYGVLLPGLYASLEGVEYDEDELRIWAEARLSEFDLTG
jgi:hypothetical protein